MAVGDSFNKSEQICQQRVELRRVSGVNARVGSSRELVANCVHTADADATQLDSCVLSVSAVCIGHITSTIKLARTPANLQSLEVSNDTELLILCVYNIMQELVASHSVPSSRWYQPLADSTRP